MIMLDSNISFWLMLPRLYCHCSSPEHFPGVFLFLYPPFIFYLYLDLFDVLLIPMFLRCRRNAARMEPAWNGSTAKSCSQSQCVLISSHTVLFVKPSCVAGVQAWQARARVATNEVQAFLSISLEHGLRAKGAKCHVVVSDSVYIWICIVPQWLDHTSVT